MPEVTPIYPAANHLSTTIYDDRVMGGISTSTVTSTVEGLRFSGEVRAENNGGFCSFRLVTAALDISHCSALLLTVSGTARTLAVRLFNTDTKNSVAYQQVCTVTPALTSHIMPLAEFSAVFRGTTLSTAAPGTYTSVCAIGFLIGMNQPGSFTIDIYSILAV